MILRHRFVTLPGLLLMSVTCLDAQQQRPSVSEVSLKDTSGLGPVVPPRDFNAFRAQGRTRATPLHVARIFAAFGQHARLFPRVVARTTILWCDAQSMRVRYVTLFDRRPGGIDTVTTISNIRFSGGGKRVVVEWHSEDVESAFIDGAWGTALFQSEGSRTVIDYVSAIRPRNFAAEALLKTQSPQMKADIKYVVAQLLEAAESDSLAERTASRADTLVNAPCAAGVAR